MTTELSVQERAANAIAEAYQALLEAYAQAARNLQPLAQMLAEQQGAPRAPKTATGLSQQHDKSEPPWRITIPAGTYSKLQLVEALNQGRKLISMRLTPTNTTVEWGQRLTWLIAQIDEDFDG